MAQALDFPEYCDAARGKTRVLVVDVTDRYDEADQKRFATGAVAFANKLNAGDRLEIYRLDNRPGSLRPFWESCVPGCRDDQEPGKSMWDTSCPRVTVDRDKNEFRDAFTVRLRSVLKHDEIMGTEIIRTMSQLAREFQNRRLDQLVIFSDLIEYSSYSQAITAFDAKHVAELQRTLRKKLADVPKLSQTEVIAFGHGKRLGQDSPDDNLRAKLKFDVGGQIRRFWEWFFKEILGVKSVVVVSNYN
ncbi:MAG: hypothetical protein HQL40_02370 [Alphaproteobacteria bacterium]|nr:hypothetical protein [Alphaproteobacteria bacterium]